MRHHPRRNLAEGLDVLAGLALSLQQLASLALQLGRSEFQGAVFTIRSRLSSMRSFTFFSARMRLSATGLLYWLGASTIMRVLLLGQRVRASGRNNLRRNRMLPV